MIQNFQEYIKNIDNISPQEKRDRERSLELFNKKGFPNKKLEEWKFTDIKKVIQQNFNELNPNNKLVKIKEINYIKDFEHNHILTINGNLYSHDFKYEDKDKVKIEKFKKELSKNNNIDNSLLDLNDSLFSGGYFLFFNGTYFVSNKNSESVNYDDKYFKMFSKRPNKINYISNDLFILLEKLFEYESEKNLEVISFNGTLGSTSLGDEMITREILFKKFINGSAQTESVCSI